MITYAELNQQNDKITELSNVLSTLLKDRTMCSNSACCDLFSQYIDQVKQHLDLVDKNLYGELLSHSDHDIKHMVSNFMSGSQEIRRITNRYIKDWCPTMRAESLAVANHERFYEDTEKMFNLILQRIQDETEKLYPLIRELSGNLENAA
jgi:hemerythrin-like domain-containing protein